MGRSMSKRSPGEMGGGGREKEREERRCQSRSDPASGKSMGGGRACECASVCVFERRGAGYLHTFTLLSAGVGGAGKIEQETNAGMWEVDRNPAFIHRTKDRGSVSRTVECSTVYHYWDNVQPTSVSMFSAGFSFFGICLPSWELGVIQKGRLSKTKRVLAL